MMAMKTKKNDNLTSEKELEQALIPSWDEPYRLPDNWCWTNLSSVQSENGFFDGDWILKENMDDNGEVRLLQLSDIGIGVFLDKSCKHINLSTCDELNCTMVLPGDVLISRMAEPIARSCIVPNYNFKMITAVDVAVMRCNSNIINNKFLNYLCNTPYFTNSANNMARGTTRVRITRKNLGNILIPLPPLVEQLRIVKCIDTLFDKLDEAKEKAQEVIDGFESRKAAILHKAFTGELTEKWRNENDVPKDSWRMKKINQVCFPRAGYAFDSKKFTNTGYQIIRMGNLYGGELDLNRNPVFISADDVDETVLMKALINDGDILITLTGTKYKRDYGYAVCIHNQINLLANQRILCLTPNYNEIKTDYLLFYLQSDLFRDIFFSNETGGVNQGNVSSKFVENIDVDIPTLDEQVEIGRILRNIIEKEQQTKETAETIIEQIDTMKKAILVRAFRGELGTNNSDEKSSIELLKKFYKKDRYVV